MKIEVLDSGYVELIEVWGHGKAGEGWWEILGVPDYEAGIIEAARQSTQGSFRGWDVEEKLLRTLFTHDPPHATPFEFAGMVIEVQAPLFVFREWHRHRTQSYNEMSARYAPLPDLYYHPRWESLVDRIEQGRLSRNKQQQSIAGKEVPAQRLGEEWLELLRRFYEQAEEFYQWGLKKGIPKELARLPMPVAHYSRMRAATNLRNWLAFMTLRMHPDAQWEIRQYANAVAKIIESHFPHTWALFSEAGKKGERLADLERLAKLASELCESVDRESEDIGGSRPSLTILKEIGPLVDKLEGK